VTQDKRADAERTVEFVGGECEGVDAKSAEVERELADNLRGIAVNGNAFRATKHGDLKDRLKHACFVAGQHDTHKPNIWREAVRKFVKIVHSNNAGTRDGKAIDLPTEGCEVLDGARDAGVFDGGGDYSAARDVGASPDQAWSGLLRCGLELLRVAMRCEEAMEDEVIRFGAAAGEDHLVGVHAVHVGAEELADACTRGLQGAARLAAGFVLARRVAGVAKGGVANGVGDFRQDWRGGVVVEVD
jgi:hypothetical protein